MRNFKRNIAKVISMGMIVIMTLILAGCGEKAIVRINDEGNITEVEVSLPKTVDKILTAAEISLGEEDQVSPSADTKISEPEEIVVFRKHTIQFDNMGSKTSVDIVGGTVGDLLKQQGITLQDKQKTNFPLDEYLKEGMEVKIFNLSTVNITTDGETKSYNVEAAKVEDAIKEAGITLEKDDRVTPERTDAVSDGMEISIERVKTETVTETETIDYEIEYQYDNSMSSGTEQTSVEGSYGEKEVTYKITYLNGEEESREVVEEKVITEPSNAVVIVGTYEAPAQSSSSGSSSGGGGRTVVSQKAYYDCDGSGHGYYEIVYSDGTTEYVEF